MRVFSTAGLDFQFHNHDWSIVDPYDIQHTPGRNFWNQRTSTNQDYQAFHVHRGTDTTRSLTNAAFSNYNSSSDTHTEIVTDLASTGGTNTGQTVNSDHSWGSTTDSSGTTTPYDSLQDGVAGQQDERTPLWITDAALQPPAMGGAGLGWQALGSLQYVPGANLQAVGQAWSAGQEAVGGTPAPAAGSSSMTVNSAAARSTASITPMCGTSGLNPGTTVGASTTTTATRPTAASSSSATPAAAPTPSPAGPPATPTPTKPPHPHLPTKRITTHRQNRIRPVRLRP